MNLFGRMALIGVAVTAALAAPAATAMAAEPATMKTEANLRYGPTTKSPVLEVLPKNTRIDILCWDKGEPTFGSDKFGSMWLFADTGGWVHSFLVTPVDVERCADAIPVPGGGIFFKNCDAAEGFNSTPVQSFSPGYGPHLDRDRDGIGCEPGE